MSEKICKLYENPDLQDFTKQLLRPGGFIITQRGLKLAQVKSGQHLLDLGCGSGNTIEFAEKNLAVKAWGIDTSENLLNIGLERNPSLQLIKSDASNLPFADSSFDCVIMECTLSVFANPNKVLSEAYRVLTPNGKLVVSDLYLRQGDKHTKGLEMPVVTCLNGIKPKKAIQKLMLNHGFKQSLWQDNSSLFKSFLAEIIMTYGNLNAFWQVMLGDCTKANQVCESAKGIKISYYLGVWQKKGRSDG